VLVILVLLSGLLPAPPGAGQPSCGPVADTLVPRVAARDGTPFAVAFLPAPCFAESFVELRVWAGNETHQASRVHDGGSWVSSQSYRPVAAFLWVDGWLWVPMKAAPDATHGERLVVEAQQAEVWLRARTAGGVAVSVPLGGVEWLDGESVRGEWGDPFDRVVMVHDGDALLAAAVGGLGADGHALPPGFAFLAVPPGAAPARAPRVAPGDLLLVRVAPALRPSGSMFELFVRGGLDDLSGLRIASRSGTLIAPTMTVAPGDVVRFALSADLEVAPVSAQVPDLLLDVHPITVTWGADEATADTVVAAQTGSFRLAQGGGSLRLVYGDVVLDAFAYGDGAVPREWSGPAVEATRIQGRVFLRAWDGAGFLDVDTAQDWARPRVHRQHQEDLVTRWFEVAGPVRVFACPDRCLEEVLLRIDGATGSIDMNLYELTLVEVVEALQAAARRGVVVRVVVDERPVGAAGARLDRIIWAVDALLEAGAVVYALGRERFDVNHAKYLVVDDEWTVVLTENAVLRGWPPDGASGNRGHGVAVRDPGLAAWTRALFEADALHESDARPVAGIDLFDDAQPLQPAAFAGPAATTRLPTLVLPGGFRVAPLLAPDHLADPGRHPVAELIADARHEVGFAQMNLPLEWRRPGHVAQSPLANALLAAGSRGVYVNGTLADAFVEGEGGNSLTARTLSSFSPRIDVRLAGSPHPDGILHAKTWWGDPGREAGWLVVGSANGNLASQAMNREFALVLAHPEAARYVATLHALDHAAAPAVAALDDDAGDGAPAGHLAAPGAAFALFLAFIVGLVLLRRRG
jgi:phosphatidylserine/phosphatidylglycerophosphate/cardiolipin synthase-like enzyme